MDEQQKNASPKLFRGKFANGDQVVRIDEQLPSTDRRTHVRQIRRICDSLYYVFLSGYEAGLKAYWNRSLERGKSQGKGRESTPGWHNAKVMARRALEEAVSAWAQYHEDRLEESRISAEKAHQFLIERYMYYFPNPQWCMLTRFLQSQR